MSNLEDKYVLVVADCMDMYLYSLLYASKEKALAAYYSFRDKGYKAAVYTYRFFRENYHCDEAMYLTQVVDLVNCGFGLEVSKEDI